MTNWITATGAAAETTSTLADTSITATPQVVVGTRNNLEVSANGTVTANTPAEHTLGQDMPTDAGVMATVQSHSGGGIYGRPVSSKDTVDIGGIRTNIETAIGMGLIIRNGDGSFSDAPQAATLKDPTTNAPKVGEKVAEKVEPEGVSFGVAGDAVMDELLAGQNPSDLYKTIDSFLHHGDMNQRTIERMASNAGVEPHEMAEKVSTVWAGAYEAGEEVLFQAGVANGEAFEAFLADNPHQQANMMEAARNFFVHHNSEGLQTMAEAYLPQMDKFDGEGVRAMLTEAGYEFAEKPEGGLQVIINGTKVSWDVAVKQRIITFSKT